MNPSCLVPIRFRKQRCYCAATLNWQMQLQPWHKNDEVTNNNNDGVPLWWLNKPALSTCKIERHYCTCQQTWFGMKLLLFGFLRIIFYFSYLTFWYLKVQELSKVGMVRCHKIPVNTTNPPTFERSPKHESPGDNGASCEPSKFVFGLHSKCKALPRPPPFTKNFPGKHSQSISPHNNWIITFIKLLTDLWTNT